MIVLNTANVVRAETSPGDLRDRRTCVLAGLTPAGPDLPSLLLRDPDLTRIGRRSGGTIIRDGQPLTTVGWRRIRRWRQDWLALPSRVIPAVIGPDHVVRSGAGGSATWPDFALPPTGSRGCPSTREPRETITSSGGPSQPGNTPYSFYYYF